MKTTNVLIAKEVHLLLPAWFAAMLLAIVPVWLLPYDPHYNVTPDRSPLYICAFLLGMVMLALSSFGREFGMRTFPLLLSLPSERPRAWRTKTMVLACAIITVFLAWALSSLHRIETERWVEKMAGGAAAAAALVAGGLCMTLLVRQIAGAIWLTILVPAAILMIMDLAGAPDWIQYPLLFAYAVAAFLLARWQFLNAQEVGWTGGTVALPGWRTHGVAQAVLRSRRPLAALLWKEIRLQQAGLLGMAGLLLVHLAVVAVRKFAGNALSDGSRTALEVFGGVWFLVPLMIGGVSIAEDRKLGTMQAQLALPVSLRVQFIMKLVVVLLVGGTLSALSLWTVEGIAGSAGAACGIELLKTPFSVPALAALGCLFLGWSLICFYASSLVGGLIQSCAASVVTATAICLVAGLVGWLYSVLYEKLGFFMWPLTNLYLLYLIVVPCLVIAIIFLGYRNFKNLSGNWRLWRRNVVVFLLVAFGAMLMTSAIYNRVWELLIPLEPPHGPARITGTALPSLGSFMASGGAPRVFLPDGRIWTTSVVYDEGMPRLGFRVDQKWIVPSGDHFLPGSNWANAVIWRNETVAIKRDGTLWVSARPRPPVPRENGLPVWDKQEPAPPLVQFGTETNWRTVISAGWGSPAMVLLKQDGTLWRWSATPEQVREDAAARRPWRGFSAFVPHQLGAETNWAKIIGQRGHLYAWKADGEAWFMYAPRKDLPPPTIEFEPEIGMTRLPEIDHLKVASLTLYPPYVVALDEEGGLCRWVNPEFARQYHRPSQRLVRLGQDRDWTSLACDGDNLVMRRADGSLWQYSFGYGRWDESNLEAFSPTRLGRHNDWLAVGDAFFTIDDTPADGGDRGWVGVVSLASDGSLWQWWDRTSFFFEVRQFGYFLTPPRKPSCVANIFDPATSP